MWKSLVATTWSQRWFGLASATEIPAATAAPPATASEPPSQKSFCTSTITSARCGSGIEDRAYCRVMHEVRGVVARGRAEPVTVETVLVPDPGPGEVLVRVEACGV